MDNTLINLKKIDFTDSTLTFWLIKRWLNNETKTGNYNVLLMGTSKELQDKLKKIVKAEIDKNNSIKEYEFIETDQDDKLLKININETEFQQIVDKVNDGSDSKKVDTEEDIKNIFGYLIEIKNTKSDEKILAFKKVRDNFKLKLSKFNVIFKNKKLEDFENKNEVFRLEKTIDFFSYKDDIFILEKKAFEAAMNFRDGMIKNRDLMMDELVNLKIVKNVDEMKKQIGTNLRYLRKISMIKNSMYYKDKNYISNLKSVCSTEGWEVEFDGEAIIVSETNIDVVLTLMNNGRLTSKINNETYDVDSKRKVLSRTVSRASS